MAVTALPTVDLTVYPFECDAFGHLNEASFLALFERARWDALAKGPGMDLFKRNRVWPAVRKATVDYRAADEAQNLLDRRESVPVRFRRPPRHPLYNGSGLSCSRAQARRCAVTS